MRGGLRTLSRRGSGVRIPPTVETTDPPHQGGVVQVGERPLPRTSLLKHTILTKPIQQPGWLGMNLVLD